MAAPVLMSLRAGLVQRASVREETSSPTPDSQEGLPRGRLLELAGGPGAASVTAAVQIAAICQREGDPIAWAQPEGGGLYPPDLAAWGLDLDAFVVVHVPRMDTGVSLARAAELLLRTGAFGAVIVDYSQTAPPRGEGWLSRLAGLAREHDCRCVLLGPASATAFGAMVALRLRAMRRRIRPGRFAIESDVLRSKTGVRVSLGTGALRGPDGMP